MDHHVQNLPGSLASAKTAGFRLVRCPKCLNILPEPPNVRTYRCGGCSVTLRARVRTDLGISMLESKLPCAVPIRLPIHILEFITQNLFKEQELGRDGYGVVYKAEDQEIGRQLEHFRLNGDVDDQSSSHRRQHPIDFFQNGMSSELPRGIPFHQLEEITAGFSKERKLGNGGFGEVYMGVDKDGQKIAVKMLYDMPGTDEEKFINEFRNLASLQHQNIVRLVGYCHETQKTSVKYDGRFIFAERTRRALYFEYMHYGSLEKHLSDEYHGLDWNTRYTLIKGICNGLKYLHEELQSPIYHLDLKPANILLDENMLPKIADFGLSRLFGEESTQITKSSLGTLGYLPPEYIERNIISNKFDIFSLGVVMIKIMTGPSGYSRSAEMSPEEFIVLVHENWTKRLQATHFSESYSKQVKICMEIALSSVAVDRHKRPSIGDIMKKLDETDCNSGQTHGHADAEAGAATRGPMSSHT